MDKCTCNQVGGTISGAPEAGPGVGSKPTHPLPDCDVGGQCSISLQPLGVNRDTQGTCLAAVRIGAGRADHPDGIRAAIWLPHRGQEPLVLVSRPRTPSLLLAKFR